MSKRFMLIMKLINLDAKIVKRSLKISLWKRALNFGQYSALKCTGFLFDREIVVIAVLGLTLLLFFLLLFLLIGYKVLVSLASLE